MRSREARERVFWALTIVAGAVALAHALWVGAVCDDAGISLAYARNLARGEGLRLTPLSPRVEAYSNPLWTLSLAAGFVVGVAKRDGVMFAWLTGSLAGAVAVVMLALVPSRASGRAPRPLDALAPWLLALDTTYATWNGSGLESGAFAAALCSYLLLSAREIRDLRSLSPRAPSALAGGLLAVLRPEGSLYVAAGLAAVLALRPDTLRGRAWRAAARHLVTWIALAAAPVVAWELFRATYYGRLVPNSYTAKSAWNFGTAHYVWEWLWSNPWHALLVAAPASLLVHRTRRAAVLASAAATSAMAFVALARGDWMEEHRFFAHALPAFALLAALAPAALAVALARRLRTGSVPAMAAVALVVVSAAGASAVHHSPWRRDHPVLPLRYTLETARWYRATANLLGLTHPRLAHFDIGATALESGMEVVDLGGLADLRMARVAFRDRAAAAEYVFGEVRPELLNIHGPSEFLLGDARLDTDYQLVRVHQGGYDFVRRRIVAGEDDGCPGGLARMRTLAARGRNALAAELASAATHDPAVTRALWLCARAHLQAEDLPVEEVRWLARDLAARGATSEPDRARLELAAAVALEPWRVASALRLDALARRARAAHDARVAR